jgi:hypothetical protein
MRPVSADPDFKPAATPEEIAELADTSGCSPEPDPAHAGWDLSMGARLNYGRDPNGQLCADLQLGPDYDGSGVIRRAVTTEQLVAHAQHLLQIAYAEALADAARRETITHAECSIYEAIESTQEALRHLQAANQH